MKINYLQCGKHNKKLFSWHQDDYQIWKVDENEVYILDGGISINYDEFYIRFSLGTIESAEIKDIIQEIRQSFTWIKNYNENNERLLKSETLLLKDLSSSHICGIISYFNNKLYNRILQNEIKDDNLDINYPVVSKDECIILEIMVQELDYRIKTYIT